MTDHTQSPARTTATPGTPAIVTGGGHVYPSPRQGLTIFRGRWSRTNRKNDGISRHIEREADQGGEREFVYKKIVSRPYPTHTSQLAGGKRPREADLFPLDQRLGLDDGEFVRKSVERRDADPERNRLHDDDAERRQAEAIAALAMEDHALASAVRREFLVDVLELLRMAAPQPGN